MEPQVNMESNVAFDEFLAYVNSDVRTWQESDETDGIKIWRRDYDPSTTLCMRNECTFPGIPPEVAFSCVADVRVRKKWDHRIERYDIIEESDGFCFQYNKLMQVPIPFFAQRDQVVKWWTRKNYPVDGTCIAVAKSAEHPSYPDGFEGCCRVHATMIGYLFTPDESINGTRMYWIYINDLKGSLPGMLVQMLAN